MRSDLIVAWAAQQQAQQQTFLSTTQLAQLACFQERLLAVNAHMNLTAITDEAEIAVKHFIDSLTLIPFIKQQAQIVDIGSGAGFPGLPLKIARPDLSVTLLDSLRKRILFLRETIEMLGLTDVTCLHGRAEELARQPAHRGQYDVCTARAVAKLSVLAGYALPFLKQGGLFLAMKGPEVAAEVEAARRDITRRSGRIVEIRQVQIAPGLIHSVVVVEKTKNV